MLAEFDLQILEIHAHCLLLDEQSKKKICLSLLFLFVCLCLLYSRFIIVLIIMGLHYFFFPILFRDSIIY